MKTAPDRKRRIYPAPEGFRRGDNGPLPEVRPPPPPPPPEPPEWYIRMHGNGGRHE